LAVKRDGKKKRKNLIRTVSHYIHIHADSLEAATYLFLQRIGLI